MGNLSCVILVHIVCFVEIADNHFLSHADGLIGRPDALE